MREPGHELERKYMGKSEKTARSERGNWKERGREGFAKLQPRA
jgi:hypothetical protein